MNKVAQDVEVSHWINLVCFADQISADDITALFLAFTQSDNVGEVLGTKYSSVPWQGDMLILRNAVEEIGFDAKTFDIIALKAIQALTVLADQYLNGNRVIESSIVTDIQQSAA